MSVLSPSRLVLIGKGTKPGYSLYQCSCGNQKESKRASVKKGKIKSCGCLYKSTRTLAGLKHGKFGTAVYVSWQGMKYRCLNPKYRKWKDYGGRGITVCVRWRESFENFFADMGEPPTDGHSIDRIDNDGNYEPGNCRRSNRKIEFEGRVMSLAGWAEELNIDEKRLCDRLSDGWSVEDSFKIPVLSGQKVYSRGEKHQ